MPSQPAPRCCRTLTRDSRLPVEKLKSARLGGAPVGRRGGTPSTGAPSWRVLASGHFASDGYRARTVLAALLAVRTRLDLHSSFYRGSTQKTYSAAAWTASMYSGPFSAIRARAFGEHARRNFR